MGDGDFGAVRFGWASPRSFTSGKTRGALRADTRLHEDFLVAATLDPEVEWIAETAVEFTFGPPVQTHRPEYELTMADGALVCVDVVDSDSLGDSDCATRWKLVGMAAATSGVAWRMERESDLSREPRRHNLRMVYKARNSPVSAGDRIRILQYIDDVGAATVVDAARIVSPQVDGVDAVLSLVLEGLVAFELDLPLVPETTLRRTPYSYEITPTGWPDGRAGGSRHAGPGADGKGDSSGHSTRC
jgi:hypothetical protein